MNGDWARVPNGPDFSAHQRAWQWRIHPALEGMDWTASTWAGDLLEGVGWQNNVPVAKVHGNLTLGRPETTSLDLKSTDFSRKILLNRKTLLNRATHGASLNCAVWLIMDIYHLSNLAALGKGVSIVYGVIVA